MRVGTLVGILALLCCGAAGAYVRSTSPKSGKPFVWQVGCIVVQADGRGSQDLDLSTIDATLARAAQNWSDRTQGCSNLRLSTVPADGPADVGADGRPVMVIRDQRWGRPGGMSHDPSVIGLTTVFHVSTPGQPGDATILDTDIELNGVNFTFTTTPATATARAGTTGVADLENTLTHELGHVQGLAHTCWDHLSDSPPLDDKGNPIPDCNGPLPESVLATTMYPYSLMPGEISKRTLSADDVRAICEVYPASDPFKACFEQVQGGCSSARAPVPVDDRLLVVLVSMLSAAAALARRRAR